MSYQRDASMQDGIASSTILAARHASMQALGISFIPCLLTKEAVSHCLSPSARMIPSSTSPIWLPSLTASQSRGVPASPHHDSHRFPALVHLLSTWNLVPVEVRVLKGTRKAKRARQERERISTSTNGRSASSFFQERKDGRNEYGPRSR